MVAKWLAAVLCAISLGRGWLVAPNPAPPAFPIDAGVQIQFALKGDASFWIVLQDRPDLSAAYQMANWGARGAYVYQQLRAAAEHSQEQLRAYLAAQGIAYQSFWIQNAVLVESAPLKSLDGLRGISGIKALRERKQFQLVDGQATPLPDWGESAQAEANLRHVQAPDAWGLGITGAGVVVANIDTGVRYTHQALSRQYRGWLGGENFDHHYNWFDPYSDAPDAPYDGHGHGTHTMGIMLGNDGSGNQVGIAPGAQWIACRGCDSNNCTDAAILACAQFLLAPTDLSGMGADPARRPQVINNSWGDCEQTYDDWFQGAVDAWQAAGIYAVFSNGNAGYCGYDQPPGLNTVSNPARYGNVTGVGSTGQANGQYAPHSNWGPSDQADVVNPVSGYEMMKPQVVAPGVSIRSSIHSGDNAYGYLTGTSMSAPHVAGLVALVWQAAPCLVGDYAATERLIEQSATPVAYDDGSDLTPSDSPNFATGWGEINALAAVQQAAGVCSATLQGRVRGEAGGQPVAGARVAALGSASPDRWTHTDQDGQYSLALRAGSYTVSVTALGFATQTVSSLAIGEGQTVRQDFILAAWANSFLPFASNEQD